MATGPPPYHAHPPVAAALYSGAMDGSSSGVRSRRSAGARREGLLDIARHVSDTHS